MAINKAIIQIRRGLKDDLQLDKLLPGELAIATDAPCMWFCWAVGEVEQIPTSDNIEEVIAEILDLSKYAEKSTTLKGYGITDGATKEEVSRLSQEIANVNNNINYHQEQINILNAGGLNLKEDFIGTQVDEWLDEHPEATTTVQDGSLTQNKFVIGALGYITPELFGAIGDGVTDDTLSIQNAINYAEKNNISLMFNSKSNYIVTSSLVITNAKINFNWCTIINNTENDYAIKVNPTSDTFNSIPRYTHLEKITINCNGKSGIEVTAKTAFYTDFKILNIGGVGLHNKYGYEAVFTRFYYEGDGTSQNIGILNDTADGHFTDHIGRDLMTAIVLNAGTTMMCRMHFWIGKNELYDGSVFVKCNAYEVLKMSQSNCDTYSIFVEYKEGVAPYVNVSDTLVMYNSAFLSEDSESYLFYMPYNSYFTPYVNRGQITNCRFNIPTKGSYKLCNCYENDKLFPLPTTNCQIKSRNNDFVDLTDLLSETPSFVGVAKIKYNDCLIIRGYSVVPAGTKNVFYLKGYYDTAYFNFRTADLCVGYSNTQYKVDGVKYAFLGFTDDHKDIYINLISNVEVDTYVYIDVVVPIIRK